MFEGLVELAQEFAHLRNHTRVENHVDCYTVQWESPDEFLAYLITVDFADETHKLR